MDQYNYLGFFTRVAIQTKQALLKILQQHLKYKKISLEQY